MLGPEMEVSHIKEGRRPKANAGISSKSKEGDIDFLFLILIAILILIYWNSDLPFFFP